MTLKSIPQTSQVGSISHYRPSTQYQTSNGNEEDIEDQNDLNNLEVRSIHSNMVSKSGHASNRSSAAQPHGIHGGPPDMSQFLER